MSDLGPVVDPTPARFPGRITLTGRFVTVAPLDPEVDSDSLWEAAGGESNAHLWRYLAQGPFLDRPSFQASMLKNSQSTDPLVFAIRSAETQQAIGQAQYMRIEPAHRCMEIGGIVYTAALQRTPGGTEAMYLMAQHAFEDLGYRRYEWKCNVLNEASRKAALRFGFSFEGIFRQHMIVKGRSRDTAWFSMLDSEWPTCKVVFERWLHSSNFDCVGRQKLSLADFRRL